MQGQSFDAARKSLRQKLTQRKIPEPIIEAILGVPRHRFVPRAVEHLAWEDAPLPIGLGQTISQPSLVAEMTAMLHPRRGACMLEVGTGSGYQAAVLAALGVHVVSVERIEEHALKAQRRLLSLGYDNVDVSFADGTDGWTPHRLFDGIVVTAGATKEPTAWLRQLAIHASLVVPIGPSPKGQTLYQFTRHHEGFSRLAALSVRFVPLLCGLESR